MERISAFQLFTLTVIFQVGTTVIFGFGSLAGRDAWITSLISMVLGIILILSYIAIKEMNPGLTLVEWFPAQFGRWLGTPLAWLYPLLFMYSGGRIFSDLKALIPSTILPGTPSWFVILIMLLVIIYCLFSGIEVLVRLTEYLLPVLFLLFSLEIFLLFCSGIVDLNLVRPILGQGWGKIWKTVWPVGVTQTFAETLALAVIWPLVNKPKKIKKATIAATVASGLTITSFNFMQIAVLGEYTTTHTVYPLYLLVKQISIADFLENLDAIVALNMIIIAYIKVTVYLFAAIRSIQLLMNLHNSRYLILPVGFVTYFLGMTMSKNINEHNYIGVHIFPLYVWVPLLIILPFILLLVTLVRKKWAKQKKKIVPNG